MTKQKVESIIVLSIVAVFILGFLGVAAVPDHEVETLQYPGVSEIELVEKYEYYDVYGFTDFDIRNQMYANGPEDSRTGETFFAFTDVEIETKDIDATCAPYVPGVVEVTYTLPNWKNRNEADPWLQDTWDYFMESLVAHERGHGQIALRHQQELETLIYNTPVTNNCIAYHIRLFGLFIDASKKINQNQIEFDFETNHGQADGARF